MLYFYLCALKLGYKSCRPMNIPESSILHSVKYVALICALCLPYCAVSQESRPIDGFGTNESNPEWGAAGDLQVRLTPAFYADGLGELVDGSGLGRPNPRFISNQLFDQTEVISDRLNLSDFTWVFGQFIDHDITLVENGQEELTNIVIPADDPVFVPASVMSMLRSEVVAGTGVESPRQFPNEITAFLDASAVYGSDVMTAQWLRTGQGGKLKTSEGNLLPWNTIDGQFNSPLDPDAPVMADDTKTLTKYYVAGDVRANENPLLITFHTLFVREHNRLAEQEAIDHPGWNDERLYQGARKKLIAILQHIVYSEWLPVLGVDITPYSGYKEQVEPRIFNEFSAAAFRLGHTLISGEVIRLDDDGQELKSGHISLKDAFFNPTVVNLAGGINPYLQGMASQVQQDFDCKIVDDVRNFLFGTAEGQGLDLAAININRGRDRGLLGYNALRVSMGFPRYSSFSDLTDSEEDAAILSDVYGTVDNVDAWVGMLAERRGEDKLFGNVVSVIIERQFQALRDGDRFFYLNEGQFTGEELADITATTMRDIIMRNTDISLMQDNVFEAMPHDQIEEGPELIAFPLDAVIYPNPIGDVLNIKLYSDVEDNVDITIMDYSGKVILRQVKHVYSGANFADIPVEGCPRGFYNVLLDNGRQFQVLKMIKE